MYLNANILIEASVVRNGGGRVYPLTTQIPALDCFLGSLKEIMVIHHTGIVQANCCVECWLTNFLFFSIT